MDVRAISHHCVICNPSRGLLSPLQRVGVAIGFLLICHIKHLEICHLSSLPDLLYIKTQNCVHNSGCHASRSPLMSQCVSPQPPSTSPPQTSLYKIPFYLWLVCFLLGGCADPSRSPPFDVRCSLVTDYDSHLQKDGEDGRQDVKRKQGGWYWLCSRDRRQRVCLLSCSFIIQR